MDDSFITEEFITRIRVMAGLPRPSDPAKLAQYELACTIASEHRIMEGWSWLRKLFNAKRVIAFGELLHRYHTNYPA